MKRVALFLLLTACASPVAKPHARYVWTEVGYQRYDHAPTRRQQAAYNESARKSMGISRAEWAAAELRPDQQPHDRWERELQRMPGYPADARHDTGMEAALNTP